jgi:hypothetical protein
MGLICQAAVILGVGVGGWESGIAAHYAPGLFAQVAERRGLPPAGCYVSSPWSDRHPIGAWLLVEGTNTKVRRRCLVADTSEPWDRPRHLRARLIELDYASARAICGSVQLANRECPVRFIEAHE